MTYAGIAASIFRDIISGKENRLTKIYDASRSLDPKPILRKAADYGQEFMGGVVKNALRNKNVFRNIKVKTKQESKTERCR